jgi:TolA-binding protein
LLERRKAGEIAGDASHALALTYGLPAPGSALDLERGVTAMRDFIARFPEHEKAAAGAYAIAKSFEHVGRLEEARVELEKVIATYGDRTVPEVAEARAQIGFVWFAQRKFEDAVAAWKRYLAAHPAHGRWNEVQRAIVEAEFLRAEHQRGSGKDENDVARQLYEEFLSRYPLDGRNPQILFVLGELRFAQEKWDLARGGLAV